MRPTVCPPGTWQPRENATSPTDCLGELCPACSHSATACAHLPARSPHAPARLAACTRHSQVRERTRPLRAARADCEPGFWCTGGERVSCGEDKYNPSARSDDQRDCRLCPPFSTTQRVENATRFEQCLCQADYFFNASSLAGSRNAACARCGVGTDCRELGSARSTLPLVPGYWRPSNESLDIRQCPDATAGCAFSDDVGVCDSSTSGCIGGRDVDSLCAPGLSGPLCLLCPTHLNGSRVFYEAATQYEPAKCADCDTLIGQAIGVLVAMPVGIMGAAYAAFRAWKCTPLHRRQSIQRVLIATTPHVKGKILLGFFFIAVRVDVVYEITLPGPVRRVFGSLLMAFSLGLSDDVGVLTCMGIRGFRNRLMFWFVAPIILAMLIVLGVCAWLRMHHIHGGRPRYALWYKSLPLVTRLLFFLYPMVTNVAFESFSCYSFDGGALSWLVADVQIDCTLRSTPGSPYHSVIVLAWAMVVVYPIGMILFVGGLLVRMYHEEADPTGENAAGMLALTRSHTQVQSAKASSPRLQIQSSASLSRLQSQASSPRLQSAQASSRRRQKRRNRAHRRWLLREAIAFLHTDFREDLCWWELVEMLRRLVLVGLFVVIERGSVTQVICACIYSLAHLLLQMMAAPYKKLHDNFTADAANFSLVVLFITLLLFLVSSSTGLAEVQEVLTVEQRYKLRANVLVLTAVLILSLVASLIVGVLLLVLALQEEHKRQRAEARLARARRLRLVENGKEVECPPIEESNFHLFLSHSWVSGQDQMRVVKQRLLEMIPELCVFLDVDDLAGGKGAEYVDLSRVVLVFASEGYFSSANCMRELLRGAFHGKQLLLMLEQQDKSASFSLEEVRQKLAEADAKYAQWGLSSEMRNWGFPPPSIATLLTQLCATAPIEWNRLTAFQEVTCHLIAEHLLPKNLQERTYVKGQLVNQSMTLPPPHDGDARHLHCSPANPGAIELAHELGRHYHMEVVTRGLAEASRQGTLRQPSKAADRDRTKKLYVSQTAETISECDHFLLYLDGRTWTRGADSDTLAREVETAMECDVHVLLCHEAPGIGQGARHACKFADIIDATPPSLCSARDLYQEIAVPMKGGKWRSTSLAMVLRKMADVHRVEASSSVPTSSVERQRDSSGKGSWSFSLSNPLTWSSRPGLRRRQPRSERWDKAVVLSRTMVSNASRPVGSPSCPMGSPRSSASNEVAGNDSFSNVSY